MRALLVLLFVLTSQPLFAQGWASLMQRADSLMQAGRHERAEALYTEAIAAMDTTRRVPAYFEALTSRARCRKNCGHYSDALTDYDRALHLVSRNAILSAHRSRLLLSKSDLLLSTAQYQEVTRTLQSLDVGHDAEAALHRANNLSIALSQTARATDAVATLDSLCAALSTQLTTAADTTALAAVTQNRAFILWQQGDTARALRDFQTAYDLLGRREDHTAMTLLANRALLLAEMGQHTAALTDINRVAEWMKQRYGTDHPDYLIVLRKKFEILLRAPQKSYRQQAKQVAAEYFAEQKRFITREFPHYTQQRRLNHWRMLRPQLSELFSLEADADAAFLYDVALFRRALALLPTAATTDDLRAATTVGSAEVQRALRSGESAVEFVCYREVTTADTVYAAIVSQLLRRPIFVKLFSASQLLRQRFNGKSLRDAIRSDNAADKDTLYSSTALAQLVWQPILKTLSPQTRHIFFAPDGLFHTLAIEYLPCPTLAGKQLTRLTTTARLCERSSQSTSAFLSTDALQPVAALLVGGLDYAHLEASTNTSSQASQPNHAAAALLLKAHPEGSWFQSLPYAAIETESIDTLLRSATLYRTISEAQLKQQFPAHTLVHLATHGYSLAIDPQPTSPLLRDSLTEDRSLLASGIALTGAGVAWRDTTLDDAILSAEEISQLQLHNVKLVVLSACQTALGQTDDEGPAGIVRGLKKARAAAVIATLWSVNDECTMHFMTAFYRKLAAGRQVREAFESARTSLRTYTQQQRQVRRYNAARMRNEIVNLNPPRELHPFDRPSYRDPYILIDAF